MGAAGILARLCCVRVHYTRAVDRSFEDACTRKTNSFCLSPTGERPSQRMVIVDAFLVRWVGGGGGEAGKQGSEGVIKVRGVRASSPGSSPLPPSLIASGDAALVAATMHSDASEVRVADGGGARSTPSVIHSSLLLHPPARLSLSCRVGQFH